MIPLKSPAEIKIMAEGRRRLRKVLSQVIQAGQPGVNLVELDQLAESLIKKQGGQPSFKMVPGYQWATCLNINQGVVHGVPNRYRLKAGDLLSVDLGIFYKGFHTDEAWTIQLATRNSQLVTENDKFLEAGKKALKAAILAAKPGNRVGHISQAIEREIKKSDFLPVRALTGHGVGRSLHEEPQIPCYLAKKIKTTPLLKKGMVLAIEVIYTRDKQDLVLLDDNWTFETEDGSLAALFEKTVFLG